MLTCTVKEEPGEKCTVVFALIVTEPAGGCVWSEWRGGGEYWARIFKRVWDQGINSQEWIPPAYVAWRAGTITLFFLGS